MTVELGGDRPLTEVEGDRLGFEATAEAIKAALLGQKAANGLVVGIEGRWGSGKSSLLNMTVSSLRRASEKAPEIIEFKPWIIGNRDALLLSLFSEIADAVDTIENGSDVTLEKRKRELSEGGRKIVKFAAQLAPLAPLAKFAGSFVPGVSLLGDALGPVADAARGLDRPASLSQEKDDIRHRLSKLNRKIIITIDDVDRLEPDEVVEVLRLVRSVADFPNIIYILCYDPKIVAHSIEAATKVEAGRAYIEKIVQVVVPVPHPEAFDLRRWFQSEIEALPQNVDEASGWRERLSDVIDIEGGRYLATPRHVARCIDGIRFFWSSVRSQVDLSDLVWLHLVKIGNFKLYSWVEKYLSETSSLTYGTSIISKQQIEISRRDLDEALLAEGTNFKSECYRLSDFLPGLDTSIPLHNDPQLGIHGAISSREVATAVRFRRLSSPDHYRLYFAAQQSRNSPRQDDFIALLNALNNSAKETSNLFSMWNTKKLSNGATKAEIILSRSIDFYGKKLTPQQGSVFLEALADSLDEMEAERVPQFTDPLSWVESRRIFEWILSKIELNRRILLDTVFRGSAIGWLTTIFRRELFAHGRVAGRRDGESVLAPEELDYISIIMIQRYKELSIKDWRSLKRPLSAMFAWLQAGDQEGVRAFIATSSQTDVGFLEILEILTSRSMTTNGEVAEIRQSTLNYFTDHEHALSRVEALSRESVDADIRSWAATILERFSLALPP